MVRSPSVYSRSSQFTGSSDTMSMMADTANRMAADPRSMETALYVRLPGLRRVSEGWDDGVARSMALCPWPSWLGLELSSSPFFGVCAEFDMQDQMISHWMVTESRNSASLGTESTDIVETILALGDIEPGDEA